MRPDTPPEGRPHPIPAEVRAERSAPLREMAASVGLPFVERDWVSNSRLALEATEFARQQGMFDPFHRAVFHAYFADGRDIGDIEVLSDIATSVGLESDAMRAALDRRDYAQLIDEDVQLSADLGITGVPAFILGNRAIIGAQPYEVFERVMAALGASKRDLA